MSPQTSADKKHSISSESDSEFLCGVVEGFYGRPWTTEQRKDLFTKMQVWDQAVIFLQGDVHKLHMLGHWVSGAGTGVGGPGGPLPPSTVCWIGVKVAVLCARQYMPWNLLIINVLNNFWYFKHQIPTRTCSEAYLKHYWRNCLWQK